MNASEVFKLACQVYDTALAQGQKGRDSTVSAEEYTAAQEASHDALKALADVIYAHFPVSEPVVPKIADESAVAQEWSPDDVARALAAMVLMYGDPSEGIWRERHIVPEILELIEDKTLYRDKLPSGRWVLELRTERGER